MTLAGGEPLDCPGTNSRCCHPQDVIHAPVLVAVGLATFPSHAGRRSHRRAGDGGGGGREAPSGPFPSVPGQATVNEQMPNLIFYFYRTAAK